MNSKFLFEENYSKMKDLHEDKIYRSYFTYDGRNKFAWVPIDEQIALKYFKAILEAEGFQVCRRITKKIQAAAHISVVLPREMSSLSLKKLRDAEMSWSRNQGRVRFQISGATLYVKDGVTYAALKVTSQDVYQLRKEIGLEENPQDFEMHISVGEK